MVILVTGANGQLGNELRILAKNSADKYVFTDVVDASEESIAMLKKLAGDDINTDTEHLDITSLDAIREVVKREKVDAIVNCAAWTNVDGAEPPEKYDLVEKLNATAPENVAIAMKEVDGWLVQISTDYVLVKNLITLLAKKTRKELLLVYMGLQNFWESRRLLPLDASILYYERHGFTLNLEGTL